MKQGNFLADARYKILRSLVAGAGESKSIGPAPNSFVWKDGAVTKGNVFGSWNALAPALAATPGDKLVVVDPSLAGGVNHLTTGNWSGITDVEFMAGLGTPLQAVIEIDDGAHLIAPRVLTSRSIVWEMNGTTDFIVATGTTKLCFYEACAVTSITGHAFAATGAHRIQVFADQSSSLHSHTFNLNDAGGEVDLDLLGGSALNQNAIFGGLGALNLTVDDPSAATVSLVQAPAPSVTYLDRGPMVDLVRYFAADPTGATDSGPVFQTAFNALAGTGLVAYVPGGTYHFDTGVTVPSNLTVMLSAQTILDSHLANGGAFGPANTLFSSLPTFAGAQTALTAIAHAGDQSVTLASVAGMAAGQELFVTIGGTGAAMVRTITGVVGLVVSLDEPLAIDWPIGATAQVVTARLKNVRFQGNGAVLQGTCQRVFEFSVAEDCVVQDLTLKPTNAPAWSASFDTGSRNCVWRRIVTRSTQQGIALEGNENSLIDNCTQYMTGALAAIAFTLNDCVQCEAIDCFAYGNEAAGQVGIGINSTSASAGCSVRGGAVVGFQTGVLVANTSDALITGLRAAGCTNGVLVSTGSVSTRVEGCDVSGNNVIGIAIVDTAKGTTVAQCELGCGPQTTQGILALGDCVIEACTSANGPRAAAFGNCVIKAQQNSGTSYRPLVEVIGGDFVLDAASGNNTALIGCFGARMRVSGVHYDLHQANARGFEAVDGVQAAHSTVSHVDCTFTGSAALDAIVVGGSSTIRMPRNDAGGFSVTLQAGALSDRGQVIANGVANVDVTWPDLQPSDRVVLSMAIKGGAPTAMPLVTYTPGNKFTVQSFAADTSTYNYVVV